MKPISHLPLQPALVPLTLLAMTAAAMSKASVPIANAGFESPAASDGGTASSPTGWSAFNGGAIQVLNPSSSSDLAAEAPEGLNVGLVTSSSNEDGLSQVERFLVDKKHDGAPLDPLSLHAASPPLKLSLPPAGGILVRVGRR